MFMRRHNWVTLMLFATTIDCKSSPLCMFFFFVLKKIKKLTELCKKMFKKCTVLYISSYISPVFIKIVFYWWFEKRNLGMRQQSTNLFCTGAHFFIGGIFSSLSNERMSPVFITSVCRFSRTVWQILFACKPKAPV